MIISPPRPDTVATVLPTADGDVLVIPYVLPFRVPAEALTMTVAEWLGLDTS
ncbi:hypothetical protein [Microtetraspora glauca]|uniref:Uncharacterized protein n=1 Tax=Microtetraspora glauca TaxID=1996 RepID=A0ABV3G635_MICGL